jgi:hypothetical protein
MPWIEILMLTIGVALIVTMICTGNAHKHRECEAVLTSRSAYTHKHHGQPTIDQRRGSRWRRRSRKNLGATQLSYENS